MPHKISATRLSVIAPLEEHYVRTLIDSAFSAAIFAAVLGYCACGGNFWRYEYDNKICGACGKLITGQQRTIKFRGCGDAE